MEIIAGIYSIKDKITGKVHISASQHILQRFARYRENFENNKVNLSFQETWNQHGEEAFEFLILEKIDSNNFPTILKSRVEYWINRHSSDDIELYDGSLGAIGKAVEEILEGKRSDLMKRSGVYKITNTLSNKVYIGSTKNLYDRFYHHYKGLLQQKHPNRHLRFASKKYSLDTFRFEIIEEIKKGDFTDETAFVEHMIDREQFYIDSYSAVKLGYNLSLTAGRPTCLTAWNKGLTGRPAPSKCFQKGHKPWNAGKKGSYSIGLSKQSVPVIQMDLEGNFIAEFGSLGEAERVTGVCLRRIKKLIASNNDFNIRKLPVNANPKNYQYKWRYKNKN